MSSSDERRDKLKRISNSFSGKTEKPETQDEEETTDEKPGFFSNVKSYFTDGKSSGQSYADNLKAFQRKKRGE